MVQGTRGRAWGWAWGWVSAGGLDQGQTQHFPPLTFPYYPSALPATVLVSYCRYEYQLLFLVPQSNDDPTENEFLEPVPSSNRRPTSVDTPLSFQLQVGLVTRLGSRIQLCQYMHTQATNVFRTMRSCR